MPEQTGPRDPGECLLPHLNAAYNLARWLTRDDHDAEDVVQEACLRALRFFDGFRGGDSRAWLLKIVRNTSYTWLQRNADLLLIIDAGDAMGLLFGLSQGRQQHRREDGDNRDHDEQLD